MSHGFSKRMKKEEEKTEVEPQSYLVSSKRVSERDFRITMDEESHVYMIDWMGKEGRGPADCSVSQFYKAFFAPFDEKTALALSALKKEMHGLTDEQIKKKWEEKRNKGTRMHKLIEYMYGLPAEEIDNVAIPKDLRVHIQQWRQFAERKRREGWFVLASEWKIFADAPVKLAGTVDAVYCRPCPTDPDCLLLMLYDFKSSHSLWTTEKVGTGPCQDIEDSPLWHYALQVNTYAWIINKYYHDKVQFQGKVYPKIKFEALEICYMDDSIHNYVSIPAPDFQEVITKMIEEKFKIKVDF